jgi:hypothetical protein
LRTAIGETVNRQSATDKLVALKNSLHSRYQFTSSMCFDNVALGPQAKSLLHGVNGGFLAQKEYFGPGGELADLSSGCDSI